MHDLIDKFTVMRDWYPTFDTLLQEKMQMVFLSKHFNDAQMVKCFVNSANK